MKKRFNVNLDKEQTERVQAFLKRYGMSFSGFINGVVGQLASGIEGQQGVMQKNPEEMTLREFAGVVYCFKKASGE